MGRQINFYMLPEDEKEFIEFVTININCRLYPYSIKRLPPKSLEALSSKKIAFWYDVFIYNTKVGGSINYKYIPQQKHYVIDSWRSYVLEFSRCGPKEDLKEGRLWAELVYWDKDKQGKDVIIRKSPDFVKLFNKVANWIRRDYRNYGGLYFSPRVVQYLKEGGKISISGHKIGWGVIEKWKKE